MNLPISSMVWTVPLPKVLSSPDDDGAAVILKGGGKDFAGGGVRPIGEDDHGPSQAMSGCGNAGDVDDAVGVLGLDDGAFFDEKAGELDGLIQGAAAVVAQVHDEAVDVLLLEAVEQLEDIGRGALGARLAPLWSISA